MGYAIPLGDKADYALAKKILTHLTAHASGKAANDPEWSSRLEDYTQRLADLKPTDREAIDAVLTHDSAVYRELTGLR
ncbi:hypothetical protein ACQP1G_20940 [Nocardia sp. CA-107356]|uniref:hypothetical protein n=1 Tax=Nocardia sp. CA-107356 TaxID=3239972 RepID=UPI003D8C19CB